MIETFFVHDVTIRRPVFVADRYNNQIPTWPGTTTTTKGWLANTATTDEDTNRTAQVSQWVLRLPTGSDVLASDRIEVDSMVFDIDGDVYQVPTLRGKHHIRLLLNRVVG